MNIYFLNHIRHSEAALTISLTTHLCDFNPEASSPMKGKCLSFSCLYLQYYKPSVCGVHYINCGVSSHNKDKWLVHTITWDFSLLHCVSVTQRVHYPCPRLSPLQVNTVITHAQCQNITITVFCENTALPVVQLVQHEQPWKQFWQSPTPELHSSCTRLDGSLVTLKYIAQWMLKTNHKMLILCIL